MPTFASTTPTSRAVAVRGHQRLVLFLLALAMIAAGCGSADGTEVASEVPEVGQTEPDPDEGATKAPVDPVVPIEAGTEAAATDAAPAPTEDAPDDAPEAAPAAPVGDIADLPGLRDAIVAVIGTTDIAAALGTLGPFPQDIAFPEDAVLAEVTLTESDTRVLVGDPAARRPVSNTVGGTSLTWLKIEDAQQFFVDPVQALGFELSSSGFSTTAQGDGTEVRTGFFTRGDFDGPARENLTLTLVARADTDYVEIDLDYTIDEEADSVHNPVSRWAASFPVPEGYTFHTARVSTTYLGSPRLGFSAGFLSPDGDVASARDALPGLLPAGGFEMGEDPSWRGDDVSPFADIAYPGIGNGSVSISESSGNIAIRPRIDMDFPLAPALEPFLLG